MKNGTASLPAIGTKVSFVYDGPRLTGVISSYKQCPTGHVEVTVTKAGRRIDRAIYIMKVSDLTIKKA